MTWLKRTQTIVDASGTREPLYMVEHRIYDRERLQELAQEIAVELTLAKPLDPCNVLKAGA